MKRIFFIIVLLSAVFLLAFPFYIYRTLPSIEEIIDYEVTRGSFIYSDTNELIAKLNSQNFDYVPIKAIPDNMLNAVMAVEDSNFYSHQGLDYIAILRAFLKDIFYLSLKEGGSTITQQLAKILFLTPEKTLTRKLRESMLSLKIEMNLSKRDILELYLNRIYFGHGAYGVEKASKLYFGRSIKEIALPQAAMLAGIIKSPNRYSPLTNFTMAKKRQRIVLSLMEKNGFIRRSDREKANKTAVVLNDSSDNSMNYFITMVRAHLIKNYGKKKVFQEGLKVFTTLNMEVQNHASLSLKEGLRKYDKSLGWRGVSSNIELNEWNIDRELHASIPFRKGDVVRGVVINASGKRAIVSVRGIVGTLHESEARWAGRRIDQETGEEIIDEDFDLSESIKEGDVIWVRIKDMKGPMPMLSLEQLPLVQGAIVAVDHKIGHIKALSGGYDFVRSEFNRVVSAHRQPGSAFKPFIYAMAIEKGSTPSTILNDIPVSFRWSGNKSWSPSNFDNLYRGEVTMREAIVLSVNTVTAMLVKELGVRNLIHFSKNLGINGSYPKDLTISLGTLLLTPLELTKGYAIFANGGYSIKPMMIRRIVDFHGRVVEHNRPLKKRVIKKSTASGITLMLKDVVKAGTGRNAYVRGVESAGKTGTTSNYKDAWFSGYTEEITATVWVGYDNGSSLGKDAGGGKIAAPIWADFIKRTSKRFD